MIQQKDSRIQELDTIVDKDTHELSRLGQEIEALKASIKTVDDFTFTELVGGLVRKLGMNAKPTA